MAMAISRWCFQRGIARLFAGAACLVAALAVLGAPTTKVSAASLSYVGVDYPWVGYGNGFGSSYSGTTVDGNLKTIRQTYHCNWVRIWCCEGLDRAIV